MGLTVGQRLWLGWLAIVAVMAGTYAYVLKIGRVSDETLTGAAVATESRRAAIATLQGALASLFEGAQAQLNADGQGNAAALATVQAQVAQSLERYRATVNTPNGVALADEVDKRAQALRQQIDEAFKAIEVRRERRAAFDRYLAEGRGYTTGPPSIHTEGSAGRAARRQYAARDVARQLQERVREAADRVAEGNLRSSPARGRLYAAIAKYEAFADAPQQRAWLDAVHRWINDSDRQSAALATAEASQRRALDDVRQHYDGLKAHVAKALDSDAGIDLRTALQRHTAAQAVRQKRIEQVLIAAGLAVAMLGLLTMIAARRPLRRLAKSTRAYVASDLSFQTMSMRNDELGELQAAVRALANRAENGGAAGAGEGVAAAADAAYRAHAVDAFDNAHAAILLVDMRRHVVAANAALLAAAGRGAEALIGEPSGALWSDEHHDAASMDAMWSTLERDGAWQGQVWLRQADGAAQPMWASGALVRDAQGNASGMVLTLVAPRAGDAQPAPAQTQSDTTLDEQLAQALARGRRQGTLAALLHIEVEQFKGIDQVLGAEDSAQLMQTALDRLYASLRAQDLVLRSGADRFTVLVQDMREPEQVRRVAEKILSEFSQPVEVGRDLEVPMRPVIGIALVPQDGESPEAVKQAAAAATARARASRKALYAFYADALDEQMQQRHGIESALRNPELFAQLRMHYEPRVFADGGRMLAVQASLCWQHPELGLLGADRFLPLTSGESATAIEEWSLEEACRQIAAWTKAGIAPTPIAVNVRRHGAGLEQLVHRVESTVRGVGIDARFLELEWDAAVLPQLDENAAAFARLVQLGVALSLDIDAADRNALGRARQLPLTRVKLGRALIDSVRSNPLDQAMARATITLARSLGAEIVVACVETEAQADFLRAEGCFVQQGPLYGAPMPPAALQDYVAKRSTLARAAIMP